MSFRINPKNRLELEVKRDTEFLSLLSILLSKYAGSIYFDDWNLYIKRKGETIYRVQDNSLSADELYGLENICGDK